MQKLAGSPWYHSGTFWQFVGTSVVSLIVGGIAAWATLRSTSPKLKLNWWQKSNTSLLTFQAQNSVVTVNFLNVPLSNPRVIELVIVNSGRRDITSVMFHGNDAIRFKVDGLVMAILDASTTPGGTAAPDFDLQGVRTVGQQVSAGDWLDLPASLIRRGQAITVTLLVEGGDKPVEIKNAPLVDVKIENQPPGQARRVLVGSALDIVGGLVPMPRLTR